MEERPGGGGNFAMLTSDWYHMLSFCKTRKLIRMGLHTWMSIEKTSCECCNTHRRTASAVQLFLVKPTVTYVRH
jgi:hypothetical protein